MLKKAVVFILLVFSITVSGQKKLRMGEKIHEEMITVSDSLHTVDLGKYYCIAPTAGGDSLNDYCARMGAKPVPTGFSYNSGTNEDFLSVEALRLLIEQHVVQV